MCTKQITSRWLMVSLAALVAVGLMGGCQPAEEPAANEMPPLPEGKLAVEQAWARPGPMGGTSAVYFRLANGTAQADTLVDVRTPATDSISIHESYHPQGDTTISAMRPLGRVPVPPQQRVALAPGGIHIMLMDLPRAVPSGDTLTVDLSFSSGDAQRLRVPVRETPPPTP